MVFGAVPALTGLPVPTLSLTLALALVFLLVLAVMVALLFDIRTNTRRTAEAVERLAAQHENGDTPDDP